MLSSYICWLAQPLIELLLPTCTTVSRVTGMGKRRPQSALWCSQPISDTHCRRPEEWRCTVAVNICDCINSLQNDTCPLMAAAVCRRGRAGEALSAGLTRLWHFPQSAHGIFYYLAKSLSSQAPALQMFFMPAVLDTLSVAEWRRADRP